MEPFLSHTGTAVAFLQPNIDTDQIIPAGELIRAGSDGHSKSLFAGWRYIEGRQENPDFRMNQEPWRHATILLAGPNFGCGSSRESAVWALREYGFRVVVAPSFGGIFYNNCFRNGLLPVELPMEDVRRIAAAVEASGGHARITADLERCALVPPEGGELAFRVPRLNREMLLTGLDQVELTLRLADGIAGWRAADRGRRPWVYEVGAGA